MRRGGLVFVLAVSWLVGAAFSAHAFSLLDGKLSINGYVQNQSSYRIGADSDQWVSSENRLQVEIDAKLHPQVTVSGIFRGTYDAMYDLRSDSDQWKRDYAGSRDNLSTEYKMRELFMDVALGNWNFRIGKQQVVWGETDGLRLMDIINPLDMRRQFITRSWEDIRIPQTMVKATYGISMERNAYLELLWNPGNIKRDKIYFDTTMSNDYKSPWTISNSQDLVGLQPLRAGGLVRVVEEDTPEWINVNKSEFGARLGGEAGGWFLTLNYFQGFSKSPVVESNLTPLEPFLISTSPGYPGGPDPTLLPPLPVPFKFDYPRERVIGFTFNKPAGLWVWRGEFATYLDKHYNKSAIGIFLPNITVVERTLQASMLGFDYKRFITWLNPEKMFFISAQVFNHHIFDYDEELRFGPYAQKPREDSYALSLLVNTEYNKGRICPEVLAVYDVAATGWYIKPRVEFKYGDHWRPEIGALVFTGDQYELPFGELNNNNEIYFRLKYQF